MSPEIYVDIGGQGYKDLADSLYVNLAKHNPNGFYFIVDPLVEEYDEVDNLAGIKPGMKHWDDFLSIFLAHYSIPLPEGLITEVRMDLVLDFLHDWKKRYSLMQEVRRILKPSGVFNVVDFKINSGGLRTIAQVCGLQHQYSLSGSQLLVSGYPLSPCAEYFIKGGRKVEFNSFCKTK